MDDADDIHAGIKRARSALGLDHDVAADYVPACVPAFEWGGWGWVGGVGWKVEGGGCLGAG
jgi:hypothetical protein